MSWSEQQPRRKGRFETKRKIEWKNNAVAGAKQRKLASDVNKVEGQRIVNITRVAEDLWCKPCNKALSFRHIESETICGLASTFKVRCPNCTMIKTVYTCNRAKDVSDNRKMMFDNNYKGAIGIIDLNKKLGLSTGKITEAFRKKKDYYRANNKRKERAQRPEIKRRRLFRQKQRSSKKSNAERKEGITYLTECGLDGIADLIDSPIAGKAAPADSPIVYFDLETTGLSLQYAEICQIAAKYQDQEFNAYMVPLRAISKSAAEVTDLSVRGGEMFLNGQKVETIPFHAALQNFLQFLSNIGKEITLVAHNGFKFDSRFLIRDIRANNLWDDFISIVYGFADTLGILKAKLPARAAAKLKFNQVDLARDLLGKNVVDDAHNALNDVKILQKIVDKAKVTRKELLDSSKSVTALVQISQRSALKNVNKLTLDCMKGPISVRMIGKMAEAGITLDYLQRAYKKGSDKGIELLLGEDIGGRPRVTKNKKVIQNVIAEVINSIGNTQINP